MPRPKKEGAPEPKKRSRNGCWPCKARKVKCDEERPVCKNCQRQGETCDYSIRLNWNGRSKKNAEDEKPGSTTLSFVNTTPAQPDPPSSHSITPARQISSPAVTQSTALPTTYDIMSTQAAIVPPYYERDQLPPLPSLPPPHALPNPGFDPTLQNSSDQSQPVLPMLWSNGNPNFSFNPPLEPRPVQAPHPTAPLAYPPTDSPYPSPSESGMGSPLGYGPPMFSARSVPSMAPPYPTSHPTPGVNPDFSFPPTKRTKMSPTTDSFPRNPNRLSRSSSYGPGDLDDIQRPIFPPLTPTFLGANMHNPLTPAASSSGSDEVHQRWMSKRNSSITAESTGEVRRVSVNSLLSDEPEESRPKLEYQPPPPKSPVNGNLVKPNSASDIQRAVSNGHSDMYGIDHGLPDLDVPKNNDSAAIGVVTPADSGNDFGTWVNGFEASPEFGFGLQKRSRVFTKGGYYQKPIPIVIPKSLELLPDFLLQSPMNLLYFHHFIHHTARILVPHDCSENPFKTILPKMAVESPPLLHLLLAYSASHRARLLCHPEPKNRIAHWVGDVFPALREALKSVSSDAQTPRISDANLATAIMLASLEIISPSTFGVSVPWQDHLGIARSIIIARGDSPTSVSRNDPASYFLTRWFTYLDILGSLSGRANEQPLFSGQYWADEASNTGENQSLYTIDCLLGMTSRCVNLLAQIAALAHQCDIERLDMETGMPNSDWRPSNQIRARGESLQAQIEKSRAHIHRPCPHEHHPAPIFELEDDDDPNGEIPQFDRRGSAQWEASETLAVNSSFHWAGILHIYRRIYILPRESKEVQNAVRSIVTALVQVRRGGTAEACCLFPMFTAGCEALNEKERKDVLTRVKGIEEVGLMHVRRARELMEKVWATGRGWEEFVQGEFLG